MEEKFCLLFGKNMSKIAKIPVIIKTGITVINDTGVIKVDGPHGSLSFKVPEDVIVKIEGDKISFLAKENPSKNYKAMLGLARASVANMVKGVSEGFERRLELSGVGYRAIMSGEDLVLSLGFSHPVKFTPQNGIKIQVTDNEIIVSGIDKTLVGNLASKIRDVRPPDPYKGKGIRYKGEIVRKKAGKAAAKAGVK